MKNPVIDAAQPAVTLPAIRPLFAAYEIYVGGVHLLSADFTFKEEAARYHIQAHIRTQGFWHKWLPWDTWFVSDGRMEGARFLPALHENANLWRENPPKWAILQFDGQQNITAKFDPDEGPDDNREIVTAAQKQGALDPLSSVLQLLGDLAIKQSCNETERVFDGKRVFDIIGSDQPAAVTEPGEYGVYSGPARRCDAGFQMIAGSWKDKEHSGFWKSKAGKEGSREPFQIWLAKLAPDLPEMGVRLESPSIWGRIVVHMSGWHYATADELKPYPIMAQSPKLPAPPAAPKNPG